MPADACLSCRQSRLVDQLAIDEYGMFGIVLMENAGRGCADTLCRIGIDGPVVICCGRGNNGGDGFVMARHLDLRNRQVRLLLWCEPHQLQGDAAHNFNILRKSEVPIVLCGGRSQADWLNQQLDGADWIVDALLGTGSQGDPRPPLDQVIDALNKYPARKLAIDLPSGLDCNTGRSSRHTFRADHTCTFVASKLGFQNESARPFLGQVHVLDIGAPRILVEQVLGGRLR